MLSAKEIFQEVYQGPFGTQILNDSSYIVEGDGWYQVVSPNRPEASRNEVIFSQLEDSDVESRIVETISFYRNLGTSFKWVVGPKTTPRDFGQTLRKHGFRSWHGRGMYCVPTEINIDVPKTICVLPVDKNNLEVFVDVFMSGWKIDPSLKSLFLQDFNWALVQPNHKFCYYIATMDGQNAGVASLFLKEKSGYLMGTNVLEQMRGKGVYKALVMHRLENLKALGLNLAASGTREKTSAPILENFGFYTAYKDEIFQYDF